MVTIYILTACNQMSWAELSEAERRLVLAVFRSKKYLEPVSLILRSILLYLL